jgi:branched-chain amino acid transport system substrate-binding protein
MAVASINSAGGINGLPIKVKSYDDQGLPDQAKTVVTKLVEEDNVVTVIGDVASSNSLEAAPVCQKAKVPMITPASTNAAVTKVGDYVFRSCFIDPFQGSVMATFASKNLHAKTAAVLVDNSQDYSKGLAAAFVEAFTKQGGKIVCQEAFQKGAIDYHSQLSNIKAANPDVIFVPTYYNTVGAVGRTARSLGINTVLLGGDGWDSTQLFANATGSLEGCYFSNHYSTDNKDPRVVQFVTDYAKKYNGEEPDAMSALSYDSTMILASAFKAAGAPADGNYNSDEYRAKLRDAIASTKDFKGVTGEISIDKDRNAQKPAVVLQVKGNSFKFVTTIKPGDIPA